MPSPSRSKRFFTELRRRRVAQVTIAYAVVAWIVLQIGDVIVEPLGLPMWSMTLVIALLALGLPITIVLAWVFDITPAGVRVTPAVDGRVTEGQTIGHYVVVERLGEGGMGVVYRARDTKLDRSIALKFLPPHLTEDPEAAERLLVEARAAARLDHPHICTIHEIGTLEDGRSFIAMAHYKGDTLKTTLQERGALPASEVAEIGFQVGRGLAHAHEAGIIHRDIKPANVVVTADGIAKILDFGIAKIAGVELTQEGAALGTIAYMSPEQMRGEAIDLRTDLWSLGVVLYELCAGERPFGGPDRVSTMHAILQSDPVPLAERSVDVPGALSSLIDHCLAKDPAERPRDAGQVVETLRELTGLSAGVAGPAASEQGPAAATLPPAGPEPTLAAEGERRQATILVAELAGRGVLEESLSPDQTDALLSSCRQAVGEVVGHHGGVVNRNTGERLQVLFGIPSAQEDDAIRAVRAARALCARIDEIVAGSGVEDGVGLQAGVASGRVVAREDESGEHLFRVVGGAAEVSVRLGAESPAGQVLVGPDCRRLVDPFFEVEEAGALPARGDAAPIQTFRIVGETGAQSRLEAAAVTGLTHLTGRETELGKLLEACEAAAAGQGGFVSIVGEAGVGKSRLLYELQERIDTDRFDLIKGRCQSFGSEVPYLPFIEVLRNRLGLEDVAGRESADLVAERVRSIDSDLEDFVPFYLQLLSVGDEERALQEVLGGEQLRVALVESLSALLTLGAQDRPNVVMLEDWHWVDTASRGVLRQLLEMVSAYPLLIVATARPESMLEWGAPANHTPIVLGPLTSEDSGVIVRSVLSAENVPVPLTRFLHDRTGGNPFFLEEVCQTLREDGTLRVERGRVIVAGALDHLELPETVQGVLRTRLDRLDGTARRLARYASVVGREFGFDVLEHALPADTDLAGGLDTLRDAGLIQQIRVVPTPSYRFKHALTQDVAYDSLLKRQRSEIHGAVGEALETLHQDRLDDQLDRLAEHFGQAGRWEKAVDYAIAATDRLWSVSQFQEAADANARALDLAKHLSDDEKRFDTQVELLLRQERLFEYLGSRERQQKIIDQLLEILDPKQHADHVAATYVRQGDLCVLTRDHDGAEQALEAAIRLSEEMGDPSLERHALRSMGLLRWHQQRHEEAVDYVERALVLDRQLENTEAVIGNLANLGAIHRSMGQYEKALEFLQQGLDLEKTIDRGAAGLASGLVVKTSYLLHAMGTTHSLLGNQQKALEYLEAAKDSLTPTGSSRPLSVVQMHYHLTAIARLYLEDGRIDEGLELYRESVELTRKTRHLEGLSTSLRMLGEVLLNLERYEEALPNLEEAAQLYDRIHDRPAMAKMWHGVAVAREALGRRDQALEAWKMTRELAHELENGSLEIEAAEGCARSLRADDPTAALRAYQDALELAARTDDLDKCGSIRYSVGIVHWEFGAYEEALKSFERAYEDLQAAGDQAHSGLVLNSIGRTLRDLGRLDEAKTRLEAAVELNSQTGESLLEAHALAALGDVFLDTGDPTSATDRFTAALEIRKELEDASGQGWMLHSLARAQQARGSADGVSYYLVEAEAFASQTGDPELATACRKLRRESGADTEEA